MMTAKPVSFFQNHCMTCHGPYGSWYESESAYGPQEHRELIRQMITGQANTTLDDEHQEIQYHLYRAMAAKSPFLAVSSRQETITTGEFLPGSEVTASVNGKAVPVTISGHTFIIPANARGMTIVGTTGGQTVILHADRQTFTAKE